MAVALDILAITVIMGMIALTAIALGVGAWAFWDLCVVPWRRRRKALAHMTRDAAHAKEKGDEGPLPLDLWTQYRERMLELETRAMEMELEREAAERRSRLRRRRINRMRDARERLRRRRSRR